MWKNKISWVVLFFFLASFSARAAGPSSATDPRKKALTRSVVFPGWGQFTEKKYFRGSLFAAVELACLVLTISQNNLGNESYQRYRQAQTAQDAQTARQETIRHDRRRNACLLGSAVVWIANMIDIYIFTKKKYAPKLAIKVGYEKGKNLSLGFAYHF